MATGRRWLNHRHAKPGYSCWIVGSLFVVTAFVVCMNNLLLIPSILNETKDTGLIRNNDHDDFLWSPIAAAAATTTTTQQKKTRSTNSTRPQNHHHHQVDTTTTTTKHHSAAKVSTTKKTSLLFDSNKLTTALAVLQNFTAATTNNTSDVANNDNDVLVKIRLTAKESFLWKGAQSELCQLIRLKLQEERTRHSNGVNLKPLLFLTVPCMEIQRGGRFGNLMIGMYGMHLAAIAHNGTFYFQCRESSNQQQQQQYLPDNLYWWLQTTKHSLEATASSKPDPWYHPPYPPIEDSCKGMGKAPLQYTTEQVRYDLRHMALQLQKQVDDDDSTETFDDAVIHFRCGDVISPLPQKRNQINYGLARFEVYTDPILKDVASATSIPNIRSIGIVTAPFHHPSEIREEDGPYAGDCKIIVQEFKNYIRKRLPSSISVKIRNDPKESIPMIYSRMVLAKITVCIRSTFCIFPAIASLGTSHIMEGGVAYFVTKEMTTVYPDIQIISSPKHSDENGGNSKIKQKKIFLPSHEIAEMGLNKTIAWLKGEEDIKDNKN